MIELKMLLENTKINRSFKSSHGLSLLINYDGHKLLFDTGPNKNFKENAAKMAETLSDLTGVILSHGHSDHTGGLASVDFSRQPIYVSEQLNLRRFLKLGMFFKFVGPPKSQWENLNHSAIPVATNIELAPNIYLIPVGETKNLRSNLYRETNNGKELDDFSDELILVLRDHQGLTLVTGCSHHGILAMIDKVQQ